MAARITRLSQRSGAPQVTIPTGAPGLATRRSSRRAVDRVGRELNRVERCDGVEGVLGERQQLKIALAEVGARDPLAGDVEQRTARVESGHGAPRLAARWRANPPPHPASSSTMPGPTAIASKTAS